MGCWNGTCGLSGVSIVHGTKVKAVIIKNQGQMPEASGFCYDYGYASPMSFIIDGIYNDYGSLEDIVDNQAMKLFKEYFINEVKTGNIIIYPDDYYDKKMKIINNDYSSISNEELIRLLERDRVNIKSKVFRDMKYEDIIVNLGFMMIHDDVYQSIRKNIFVKSKYHFNRFLEKEIRQDCIYAIEDFFENKNKPITNEELDLLFIESDNAVKNNNQKLLKEVNEKIKIGLYSQLRRKYWEGDIRKVGEYNNKVSLFQFSEGKSTQDFIKYLNLIEKNYDKSHKEEYINIFSEMIILVNIMRAIRVPWSAQTGKGGQDFETKAYIGLANGIKQAIKNYNNH